MNRRYLTLFFLWLVINDSGASESAGQRENMGNQAGRVREIKIGIPLNCQKVCIDNRSSLTVVQVASIISTCWLAITTMALINNNQWQWQFRQSAFGAAANLIRRVSSPTHLYSLVRLVMENEDLRGQMKQTERDTIDVITYLKKEDQTKDEQIFKLQLVSQYFLIL